MPVVAIFRCRYVAMLLLAVWACANVLADDAPDDKPLFRAGAYAIDVTPEELPVLVNGGMVSRTADQIVDRLHARCLVLDDGTNKIAIVVVDSCMLPRDLLDQAKELASKATKIPTDRMLISATHTHSAPAAMGCLGTDADKKYAAFLPARIARGIQLAHDNLEPARIGWSKSRDAENVYCRRFEMKEGTARTNPFSGKTNDRAQMNPGHNNPNAIRRTGPVDDEVFVVSVQAKDGRPIAMLANYSTHYAGAPALSADYFGVFAENIAKLVEGDKAKPAFVAMMSNGTSGDANCLDFTRGDRRKFDRFTVAEDTAAAAMKAYEKIKYLDWAPIVMAEGLLTLDVRMPTEDEVAKAKAFLATDEGKKLRTVPAVYARETVILSEMPPTRELKLQAIRIGGLGIATFPNEVYGSTGLAIKKDSPLDATFNIELANGADGYIPPPDQHKLGGYTTWRARTSCLEEEAEPKIRVKLLELLKEVAADPASGERKLPETASNEVKSVESNGEHNQGAHAPRSPLSPADSLKYLHVRPGMKVELVAAEPLIRDPVAFDWGPDGKLWVVEYLDYPTGIDGKGTGGGRVVFLEDDNDDGRYDRSTLFIDKLNFPTGVMAWRDGILITAAPDILYAEDTNNDGKADKVEKLYTGFHEANQQLRVNGLRWGLDNWIHCASGSHHAGYGKESRIKSTKTGELVHIGARDFRIRPDEGLIEPTSGPSQFGRNRDAWGNWFGTQNAKPMFHYVLEDRYLRRNPHVKYPESTVLISDDPGQRPVFPRSKPGKFHHASQAGRFTSANSAMIYGDELLGNEFIGNSFVSEPVHNLVHREIVERNGVTFKSYKPKDEDGAEFLASEDTWFRPTTIRTGPDGALWIADMYREIIEHPQWVSDELKPIVDTRSGTDRGRIYRIYPDGAKLREVPRIGKLHPNELLELIASPNATLRDMAHLRIVTMDRPLFFKEELNRLANKALRPQTRVQALCAAEGLPGLRASPLTSATHDENPWVRREALRLLESRAQSDRPYVLLDRERDERDPAVRLQLAYSLGQSNSPQTATALAQLLVKDHDHPLIVAAAMSSVNKDNVAAVLKELLESSATSAPPEDIAGRLLGLAAAFEQRDALAAALAQVLPDGGNDYAIWQLGAVGGLMNELKSPFADWIKVLPDGGKDAQVRIARLLEWASSQSIDKDGDPEIRVRCTRLLGFHVTSRDKAIPILAELLSSQTPSDVQHAAVDSLGQLASPDTPTILLGGWRSHSPQLRSHILNTLLSRGSWTEKLLSSIETGKVAAADIDAARRERLLKSGNAKIREKAATLFAGTIDADRAKVVAAYQPALESLLSGGDLQHGKAVFRQRCSACHKLEEVGNDVGPDLRGLTDKSPGHLLASILDPNRAVEPKYVSYQAVTEQGRIYNGMLAEESGGSLTLLDAEGKRHVILRRDLDELSASGKSLMPEGLEKDIDEAAMRDLLRYLQGALNSQRD